MALVLNSVWLVNARQQLLASAEAAALAAAGALVDDSLLLPDFDPAELTEQARRSAETSAAGNLGNWTGALAASPVAVDVRFGRVVVSSLTGHVETLETEESPNAVIVHAYRDRDHANPVAMLLPAFTGRSATDVTATAEASITNLVAAIRPFPNVAAPVWPLAVREQPLDGVPLEAWVPQIEQRAGEDRLSWDAESRSLLDQPDGLPEIRVVTRWNDKPGNIVQVMVSDVDDETMSRQYRNGWTGEDLASYGGEFPTADINVELSSSRDVSELSIADLEPLIGQPRLLLLYAGDADDKDTGNVTATRMVAARLMAVEHHGTHLELILQPAVVATRMAVLDEDAYFGGETLGHPYLYKLSLTQ